MSKKILIFGSGVIGSTYAALLSNAGFSVSMLARGKRAEQLKSGGLLYFDEKSKSIEAADVEILEALPDEFEYDYIFVAVRYEQVILALEQLKTNASKNIVTMVNNPYGYKKWDEILKNKRLIAAFPNTGGKIENGVLYFKQAPGFFQKTTTGEINGIKSVRIKELKSIFKKCGLKTAICNDMDAWQKTHLALVTSMADGIYYDGGDALTTSKNKKALAFMADELKENFKLLKQNKIPVKPARLKIIRYSPKWFIRFVLKRVYKSKLAEAITPHALNAKTEMLLLREDFLNVVNNKTIL